MAVSPFLALPPELRIGIYELVLENRPVRMIGNSDTPGVVRNGLALLQVCKLVRKEVIPIVPPISETIIMVFDFPEADMKAWVEALGDDRVDQLRKIYLSGIGRCTRGWHIKDASLASRRWCSRYVDVDPSRRLPGHPIIPGVYQRHDDGWDPVVAGRCRNGDDTCIRKTKRVEMTAFGREVMGNFPHPVNADVLDLWRVLHRNNAQKVSSPCPPDCTLTQCSKEHSDEIDRIMAESTVSSARQMDEDGGYEDSNEDETDDEYD